MAQHAAWFVQFAELTHFLISQHLCGDHSQWCTCLPLSHFQEGFCRAPAVAISSWFAFFSCPGRLFTPFCSLFLSRTRGTDWVLISFRQRRLGELCCCHEQFMAIPGGTTRQPSSSSHQSSWLLQSILCQRAQRWCPALVGLERHDL